MRNEHVIHLLQTSISHSVWVFGRNRTDLPFVTSDHPVAFRTNDNRMWLRIPHPYAYVVYPLAPAVVVYAFPESTGLDKEKWDLHISPVIFTRSHVASENTGQAFVASRFVYSSTADFDNIRDFVRTRTIANLDDVHPLGDCTRHSSAKG